MKIYVITRGCYSDYHICAVTENKNIAKKLREKFSDEYDDANIEVYNTDESYEKAKYSKCYECIYTADKDIVISEESWDYKTGGDKVRKLKEGGILYKSGWRLQTFVYANDEARALKVSNDRFMKHLAEKQGL